MGSKEATARYYRKNTEKILAKQRANRHRDKEKLTAMRKQLYKEHRERIDEIKLASGCVVCGYNKHPAALDFDHVNGEKSFQIAACLGRPWRKIVEEMTKCEIVCANCHRIRTTERKRNNAG